MGKEIKHEQVDLKFNEDKNSLNLEYMMPSNTKTFTNNLAGPMFQLGIAGNVYSYTHSYALGYAQLPWEMKVIDKQFNENEINIKYYHEKYKLSVMCSLELVEGTSVIRQVTTAKNEGDEDITLTQLTSMFVPGICLDGIRPWYDPKKIKFHYCIQNWQAEGQWRDATLADMGMFPTSNHNSNVSTQFSSIGSFSSARYLPMFVIEDIETNQVWYVQIESSTSWHFGLGYRGVPMDDTGCLFLQAGGADERNLGWAKTLKPGESFTTIPVSYGCCEGGFTEAIRELNKYRRKRLVPRLDNIPLVYNDFMNALSGNPSIEKLIPLIDSVADMGVEYFCIDAGWFGDREPEYGYGMQMGDWIPSKDRFGEMGLQGILDYIKSKGMKPGLWLEIEMVGEESQLANKPKDWFLCVHNKRAGGGPRYLLNYANKQVREYAHSVVSRLVDMGAEFFKNDYNNCTGIGDDTLGTTAADGLIKHMRGFYKFIDEVLQKYPNLIIENCSSGAMRQDYGILSHFHLQSTSDQEYYNKYTSITCNSLAGLLPEQAGLWAYPYYLYSHDGIEVLTGDEYRNEMIDGERTIYCMINGMVGALYLSGMVHYADELNKNLIKEGIKVFKDKRGFISNAYPFWSIGFNRIEDDDTWASVGLTNEDNDKMLLAVWRLNSSQEIMKIPLYKCEGKDIKVNQIYPISNEYRVNYYYNRNKGSVTIHFDKCYMARFFEIEVQQNGVEL